MRAAIRTTLLVVLFVWGATVSVQAATCYVAQGAPNASDENPGTQEEPWKTLTHAAETAATGDTVYVKAGTYRERLTLEGEGVTIQAFEDDSVVVEPDHQVMVIDPGTWKKAPERECVYTRDEKVGEGAKTCLLRVDGLAVAFEVTQGSRSEMISGRGEFRKVELDRVLEDDEGRRWTVDREGNLYVNLGGEDPAEHRVELIKAGRGGVSVSGKDCRVKGLEFRFCGLSVAGQGNIVEDCSVWKSTGAGWSAGWGDGSCGVSGPNVVRRCTFYRCSTIGVGTNAVFEENLVLGGQRWVREQEPPRRPRSFSAPSGARLSVPGTGTTFSSATTWLRTRPSGATGTTACVTGCTCTAIPSGRTGRGRSTTRPTAMTPSFCTTPSWRTARTSTPGADTGSCSARHTAASWPTICAWTMSTLGSARP